VHTNDLRYTRGVVGEGVNLNLRTMIPT
jgi:hypothetical protein